MCIWDSFNQEKKVKISHDRINGITFHQYLKINTSDQSYETSFKCHFLEYD